MRADSPAHASTEPARLRARLTRPARGGSLRAPKHPASPQSSAPRQDSLRVPGNPAASHQPPPAASRCPRPCEGPVTPDQRPVLGSLGTGSPCVSQRRAPPRLAASASARPAGPGCHRAPALGRPQRSKASGASQGGRRQQPGSLQAHASARGAAHPRLPALEVPGVLHGPGAPTVVGFSRGPAPASACGSRRRPRQFPGELKLQVSSLMLEKLQTLPELKAPLSHWFSL